MKIDIAESLLASWLRHEKKCQLVQTNWKAPSWQIPETKAEVLMDVFSKIIKHFNDTHNIKIFKNIDQISSLFKQMECDTVGAKWNDDETVSLHIGDIAYHAKGLYYSDVTKTRSCEFKVVAKILVSILAVYAYWNVKKVEVFFVSPKVQKKRENKILEIIDKLNVSESLKGLKFDEIKVYIAFNDKFKQEISRPIHELVNRGYTNTNELYLRSVQLYSENVDAFGSKISQKEQKDTQEEEKIGAIVQEKLRPLLKTIKDAQMIENLCDGEWCKKTFKLNFPLLVSTADEQAVKKHHRYYVEPVECMGKQYRITSQWYKWHRISLENWLNSIMKQ